MEETDNIEKEHMLIVFYLHCISERVMLVVSYGVMLLLELVVSCVFITCLLVLHLDVAERDKPWVFLKACPQSGRVRFGLWARVLCGFYIS